MRADGKRVKAPDAMYAIVPYIMNKRYDAMNMITVRFPYQPVHDYIKRKRKEGVSLSHMAVLLAAYLRVAAEFPLLNRFVVNKKIYARNSYTISMVIMRPGDEEGTMTKVDLEPTDTIFDVNRKMNAFIDKNKAGVGSNSTDRLMKILLGIPGLVNVGIGLFKLMDRFGLLPKALIQASPFHASLCISNLASIRTGHIYHHCYEFGTVSLFITIGIPEKQLEMVDGVPKEVRYMPLGIVMDERICSGHYFSRVFRRLSSYMDDPSLLEMPPKIVNYDDVYQKA